MKGEVVSEVLEPTVPEEGRRKRQIRVLYIFAGVKRKADVAACLRKIADPEHFDVQCWNVDLLVDKEFDVTNYSFRKKLLAGIRN